MEDIKLYRDKYTKEQFKEKLENTFCRYSDYGFYLELKEDLNDENNPYFYELTKTDCYLKDFNFSEVIVLDWDDEDYKCFEYDGGSIRIEDEFTYFGIFANELQKYAYGQQDKIKILQSHIDRLLQQEAN